MEVIIEGGGHRITLDDEQRWVFAGELAKAKSTHPSSGVLSTLAPDCRITIKGTQWEEVYDLYSRSVLHDPATNEAWQFYFGLLLIEWLYE